MSANMVWLSIEVEESESAYSQPPLPLLLLLLLLLVVVVAVMRGWASRPAEDFYHSVGGTLNALSVLSTCKCSHER
jgi:hypothetical protein